MHPDELKKYALEMYADEISAAALPCVVGNQTNEETTSYFGGMPLVEHDFQWPLNRGYPLNFIGQLDCANLDLLPVDWGHLLFFYDNRHWGYAPRDMGHAIVMHQAGERQTTDIDLPACEVPMLWGLLKKKISPKVYRRIDVLFEESRSYPSWERELISFNDSGTEEAYIEFCNDRQPLIQIGGYPNPIQSDNMEQDCVRAVGLETAQQWRLLLQLNEVGDMTWGDAGALYWFIHEDDLRNGRFDRVWMVTQCH